MSIPRKTVEIFTDGACSGNPGPGGWAAILRYKGVEKELCGFCPRTTSNRMELKAVLESLKALKEPCHVILYTDSRYLKDGITRWIQKWLRNGWMTTSKEPVKNRELWEELHREIQRHRIDWHWVPGHSGHLENERCDRLAREAIQRGRRNG